MALGRWPWVPSAGMLVDHGADPDPAVAAQAALVRLQAAEQEAATGTHCGVLMFRKGRERRPVYASLA
jgi:hypothetical protein